MLAGNAPPAHRLPGRLGAARRSALIGQLAQAGASLSSGMNSVMP